MRVRSGISKGHVGTFEAHRIYLTLYELRKEVEYYQG